MLSTSPTQRANSGRLRRNGNRSRIAGVCAGLSDYTGLGTGLFRAIFLGSLLFGGLGLWIYLLLWILIPSRESVPIPDASLRLRWHLYRIGRVVNQIHKHRTVRLADRVQLIYDAIRKLAPFIDPSKPAAFDGLMAHIALIDFPALLDRIRIYQPGEGSAAEDNFVIALDQMIEQTEIRTLEIIPQPEPDSRPGAQSQLSSTAIHALERLRTLSLQLAPATGHLVQTHLLSIEEQLKYLLTLPPGAFDTMPISMAHDIDRIANDFLPATLESYLKLEGPMVREIRLRDEKTAEGILNDQLALLDTTLTSYSQALFEKNARSLMVHGRFLDDKFKSAGP
jgi:phage shock protein C